MSKNSKQRQAVLDTLLAVRSHPTADQLYEYLKKDFPNISRATVYRNLKRMTNEGLVRELSVGGSSKYDGNMTEHYHFICKYCGSVTDVLPGSVSIGDRISYEDGFQPESYMLYIYGICALCGKGADTP